MTNITIFDTELQNNIARLLYEGGEVNEIANILSCSPQIIYDLKNSHKFATVCYNLAMQELMTVGAKEAVKALIEIVKDKKTGRNTRTSAADKLLHYTGLRVTESGNVEKSPATMSQAELHQRLQMLQAEAANRAKTVTIDSTPVIDSIDNMM